MNDPTEAKRRTRKERGVFEKEPGSGVWWVCYFDADGRRHREKVGPKGLAKQVYQKRKTEIREHRFFPKPAARQPDITIEAAIDQYLEAAKARLRSHKDAARYGTKWKVFLAGKTLRQVTPADVEAFAGSRVSAGAAPSTINHELGFLKRLYNVRIRNGDKLSNPVSAVKPFKEDNSRVRFLTADEEAGLRAAIGEAAWPVIVLATNTGLRRGELFALRWNEIDFANGIITIPRTKNGEVRRIPMNDAAREILRRMPSRLKGEWVFLNRLGTGPRDAHNFINRVFVPAVREAGIRDFHFHDLRHTFASRLAMAGADLVTIQKLLGHKSITMTLRYAHLSDQHLRDAVQRLVPPQMPPLTSVAENSN